MDVRRQLLTVGASVAVAAVTVGCGSTLVATSVDGVDTAAERAAVDDDPAWTTAKAVGAAAGVEPGIMAEYLRTQDRIADVIPAATAAAGDRRAGVWIDWRPHPVLVVSMTPGPRVDGVHLAVESLGEDAEVRYGARHTVTELLALHGAIRDTLFERYPAGVSGGVDEAANVLVLRFHGVPDVERDTFVDEAWAVLSDTLGRPREALPIVVETIAGFSRAEG